MYSQSHPFQNHGANDAIKWSCFEVTIAARPASHPQWPWDHNCIDTLHKQPFVLTWKELSWKAQQCAQSSSKSRNHLVGINSWSPSVSHLKRTASQATSAVLPAYCWVPLGDDFWSWLSCFDTYLSAAVWVLGRERNSKRKEINPLEYFLKGGENCKVLGYSIVLGFQPGLKVQHTQ